MRSFFFNRSYFTPSFSSTSSTTCFEFLSSLEFTSVIIFVFVGTVLCFSFAQKKKNADMTKTAFMTKRPGFEGLGYSCSLENKYRVKLLSQQRCDFSNTNLKVWKSSLICYFSDLGHRRFNCINSKRAAFLIELDYWLLSCCCCCCYCCSCRCSCYWCHRPYSNFKTIKNKPLMTRLLLEHQNEWSIQIVSIDPKSVGGSCMISWT